MSGRYYWRPGDGRSMRRDRVPPDMRLLGRVVPRQPLEVGDTDPAWMPLAQLRDALEQASATIAEVCPGLDAELALSHGHYPEVASLPFGAEQRETLSHGMYLITDAGPKQRVLYVGSGCDSLVRSRLISHLFDDRRLHNAQAGVRRLLHEWDTTGFPQVTQADHALRLALWGQNRWLAHQGNLGGARQAAAELVACGAFDVAAVCMPAKWSISARCLERFCAEHVRAANGWFPPLNDAPVHLDKHGSSSAIGAATARSLFAELDRLARQLA